MQHISGLPLHRDQYMTPPSPFLFDPPMSAGGDPSTAMNEMGSRICASKAQMPHPPTNKKGTESNGSAPIFSLHSFNSPTGS